MVIQIKDRKTQEVVKIINTTGKSDRAVEKVRDGVEINLNHDKFYVEITDE